MEPSLAPSELLAAINAAALFVTNLSGGDFAAAALVFVSGVTADGTPKISLADADAGVTGYASHVLVGGIASTETGYAFKRTMINNVNTAGAAVSDPVYLSATAGAFTLTRPTGNALVQIVGRVTVVSATVGQIMIDLSSGGGLGAGAPIAGQLRATLIAGGAAGNLTVTGINVGDRLVYVSSEDDTSGITVNLTAEFSITAANTINNAGGTSTAAHHVAVWYEKLTA